jgi:hypothetical protein
MLTFVVRETISEWLAKQKDAADGKAASGKEVKEVDEDELRKQIAKNGTLQRVAEYLAEQFEEPLFDIKDGGSKAMMYVNMPRGWRLATKEEVESDKGQVFSLLKPKEVAWTRPVKKAGTSIRRYKVTMGLEDPGPVKLADNVLLHPDGSYGQYSRTADAEPTLMLCIQDIRDPRPTAAESWAPRDLKYDYADLQSVPASECIRIFKNIEEEFGGTREDVEEKWAAREAEQQAKK